ncbi:prephenate dehydrogenase [Arsenicicoccus piscis]|uniref:prephenate dehydrogenase n=1 Tax=Arsenicicoccus piscis TaxID=673954 RepID=UPI0032AFFA61
MASADDHPDLVVVAAPPDVVADVVVRQLAEHPDAVVTDVASVKSVVLQAITEAGADLGRYVGSHPMAGRERSGAVAARADLFEGRAYVVVPSKDSTRSAVELVRRLAVDIGCQVTTMSAREHDDAVAAVSHVPQVMASLTAGRLRSLSEHSVALSGQGIRDVTRIAASDPQLWTQILAGNAGAVRSVLREVYDELGETLAALEALGDDDLIRSEAAPGARKVLASLIADGNAGQARIPGKHGSAPTPYATVVVVVPDEPGALGRLFQHMGEAGINLEDLHLEHALGHPVGLAEISVLPAAAEPLREQLTTRGWRVH